MIVLLLASLGKIIVSEEVVPRLRKKRNRGYSLWHGDINSIFFRFKFTNLCLTVCYCAIRCQDAAFRIDRGLQTSETHTTYTFFGKGSKYTISNTNFSVKNNNNFSGSSFLHLWHFAKQQQENNYFSLFPPLVSSDCTTAFLNSAKIEL